MSRIDESRPFIPLKIAVLAPMPSSNVSTEVIEGSVNLLLLRATWTELGPVLGSVRYVSYFTILSNLAVLLVCVSALGVASGGLVHVLAAVIGLSALLAASAEAFTAVKILGA